MLRVKGKPNWIATIPLVLICLRPSALWCQYSPAAGPYKVLTADNIALHDLARKKYIPIKIYYPDAAGPFPVIIFSHGALASKDNYSAFGQFWASNGYVSIHLSHADSVVDSGFRGTLREALSDPRAWQNRRKTFLSSSIRWCMSTNSLPSSSANSIFITSASGGIPSALIRLA